MRRIPIIELAALVFAGIISSFSQTGSANKQPGSIVVADCRNCMGIAISLPNPEYPLYVGYGPHKFEGEIGVQIVIDENGRVESAKAIFGHPYFRPMLEKAALTAKFKPPVRPGSLTTGVLIYKITPSQRQIILEKSSDASLSLGILNERMDYFPGPKYPRSVLQPSSSGRSNVQITINIQDGTVVDAKGVSGHPIFKEYVEDAARKARFKPIKIEGSPLFAKGVLIYEHTSENIERGIKKSLPIIVTGVVNKKAIKLPKPKFPTGCRCYGRIKVRIVIDESGKVIDTSANSGDPRLVESAIEAARNTKFAPTFINGGRFYVVGFLEYVFDANGNIEMPLSS